MKFRILAIIFLLLAAHVRISRAQEFVPTPVTVSSEKITLRGETYFVHNVLQGQTLYSIARIYGVKINEIQAVGSNLDDGLKAGMILYIPVREAAEIQLAAQEAQAASQNQVTDTSAQITETPMEPQEKADADKKTDKKKSNKKYRKYTLKWYETLDDVAEKFDVTVEAIAALNELDLEGGKRIRSILIPDREYMEELAALKAAPAEDTHLAQMPSGVAVRPADSIMYTITLVLPFNTAAGSENINTYISDFYAGVLTAASDLKQTGRFENFRINVIDLSQYSTVWEMLSTGVLDSSSLIIGPVAERDLHPVASYARFKGIPIVSPLDVKTEQLAENNPYFILFPPSANTLSRQMDKMEALTAADTLESITVIYERSYESSPEVIETLTELEDRGLSFTSFCYDFLQGRGIDTSMIKELSPVKVNNVIIPSNREAFINDALRNLNLIKSANNYTINVYGMNRWKGLENIELSYLHALDVRLALAYHTDYSDSTTKAFMAEYQTIFNTTPTSFAFQGYDILTCFVQAINTYGKDFLAGLSRQKTSLLQSDVLLTRKDSTAGYTNDAVRNIRYTKDWIILSE